MIDPKKQERAKELFAQAKSNHEAPMMGRIYTPVCVSCTNMEEVQNGYRPDRCKVYGKIPREYDNGLSADCPEYERIPNCPKHDLPWLNLK